MRRPEGTCPGCWQFHDSAEMCWPPVAEDRRYGDPDEGGWSAETDRLESYLLDISNPRLDTRRGTPGFVVDEAKTLTARLRAGFADGSLTVADLPLPAPPAASRTPQADAPDPSWPTCTNCECPIQPGETHRAARRWNEELPGSCYIDDLPALASRTPQADALANLPDDWRELRPDQADAIAAWWKAQSQPAALASRTPEPGDDGRLDGLRALSDAATPGPWSEGGNHREVYTNSDEVDDADYAHYVIIDEGGIDRPEDQAVIVAAVNYVRSRLAARSTPPAEADEPEPRSPLVSVPRGLLQHAELAIRLAGGESPLSRSLRRYGYPDLPDDAAAPLPTEQADGELWIGSGDQCPDGYEVRGINGSWHDAIDWNNDTYNDGEVIDWVRFPLRRTPDLTPADPEIAAEG